MAVINPQNDLNQNPRITWEGCSVLLDINDGDRLEFARLSAASTLKIGDKKCSLQPLVGCPFGSSFQVETGEKGPYLSRILAASEGDSQEKSDTQSKGETKDNRALVDNNSAQSLSGQDIDALRRQGASGDEIVEALIANSSTFDTKTSFSQEKYRIKKQKKYAPRVLLRRPFSRSICEAYFKNYPARIGHLRLDTLSLLLSTANVSAYSDVLVVDMVGGLLTGAVAERLGGHGYVCNAYFGVKQYQIDIVRIFNFNDKICSSILQSTISDLSSSQTTNSSENPVIQTETAPIVSGEPSSIADAVPMSIDETDAPSSVRKTCKPPKPGEKPTKAIIDSWKSNGFSSLIIAAPELDTWSTIQDVLPLLASSAPFSVYHQYLQPLATCMHKLQAGKMAISLQITEPWLREYQVLPLRTHPFMQMSGFGGYILSGIKVSGSTQAQE
ncbi:hypothetical protein ACHQM5_027366 [Ranunculus cassubicifolius]